MPEQPFKPSFEIIRPQPLLRSGLVIKCPRCKQVIAQFAGIDFDFIISDGMDIVGVCVCGEQVSANAEAARYEAEIAAQEQAQLQENNNGESQS